MQTLLSSAVLTVVVLSGVARADAYPWDGATTLATTDGKKMVWTVKREDGAVLITGTHPNWSVEHRAKPDATPISTTKKRDGKTTKVTYTATGADLERSDAQGNVSKLSVKQSNLWDTDSLDARLAGIAWTKGKKVRFHIIDIDAGDGSTYPMVVEYVEEATCGSKEAPVKCHHVKLSVDDFRGLFAPTFHYWYGAEAGEQDRRHDGDGFSFSATAK